MITMSPISEPEQKLILMLSGKEMMRFEGNGDIYVKGELVENDKEVVSRMREFLNVSSYGGR